MTLRDSIAEQFRAVSLATERVLTSPQSEDVGPRRLGFTRETPSSGESLTSYSLIGGVLVARPGQRVWIVLRKAEHRVVVEKRPVLRTLQHQNRHSQKGKNSFCL